MDHAKRMTVERAKGILERTGVKLNIGRWVPTHTQLTVCAGGLYILDQIDNPNPNPNPEDLIDQVDRLWRPISDAYIYRRYRGNTTDLLQQVAESIADAHGLSHDYIKGLSNGFEADDTQAIAVHDDTDDYRLGFADGEELAKYAGIV